MKSGKYTVDRFEEELVVLLYREDETVEVIKNKSEIPIKANEGDILSIEFDSNEDIVKCEILVDETEKAREVARELLNKLRNK